jgi:hypothetical protein
MTYPGAPDRIQGFCYAGSRVDSACDESWNLTPVR